jgi:anthranilate phosphoribosyltransferase
MSKGSFSLRILERKENSGATDTVIANAALLFQLHAGGSFKEAFGEAREAFESNNIMAVVQAVAQATRN